MDTITTDEVNENVDLDNPTLETESYKVFDLGCLREETDVRAIKSFITLAEDMGEKYKKGFLFDEVRDDGSAVGSFPVNIDMRFIHVVNKESEKGLPMPCPDFAGLDTVEHLRFIEKIYDEAGASSPKSALLSKFVTETLAELE